ncbi:hypothetical protein A6A25_30895 [Saccharothrix sp. CB00851]|nr:hypothetical protein A6A25_30895 [Saccharothrix sp. CB00851]
MLFAVSGEHPSELVAVRRWAASALRGLGDAHLSDVLLVATELVANVYDHAPGPSRLRMRHSPQPCRVWIEVDDTSTEMPETGRSRLGEHRGRGLTLIDAIAEDWGVRALPDEGKTVWALIDCDGTRCGQHRS